jgi:hypothetical protein
MTFCYAITTKGFRAFRTVRTVRTCAYLRGAFRRTCTFGALLCAHDTILDMRAKGFAASTSFDPIPALATLPSKNFCERIAA